MGHQHFNVFLASAQSIHIIIIIRVSINFFGTSQVSIILRHPLSLQLGPYSQSDYL